MKYRELFSCKEIPVFQNKMFIDRASALTCVKGDVALVQDIETGLIFNRAFDPKLLKYDADYQNEQACSAVFQRHLEDVGIIMNRHFSNKTLIEVGCGKGYFLEYLQQSGYKITGIDPAYEGNNANVIKACFDMELGISADAIVLRHVLEHMADPVSFLSSIAKANGGEGRIYIEVPCFDWICQHRAWFDIFYEHVNYFRLSDFYRMFGKVHESGHIFGGQYLYIVADLATLRPIQCEQNDLVVFPEDFLSGINRMSFIARSRRSAIWGGASKGVMFSFLMQRAGVNIDLIIDISPAKQNKFTAGGGLEILPPEKGISKLSAGDNVFVMNSNYLDEIIDLTKQQFNYIEVDHDEF